MLGKLEAHPTEIRSLARAEAARLFKPDVVCETISRALEDLVEKSQPPETAAIDDHRLATRQA
jgi:hypothetical protein